MSHDDNGPSRLTGKGYQVHEQEGLEKDHVLEAFAGYVTEVVGRINDGKEATVYLCRASDEIDDTYVAAKVYRARRFRNFDNDRSYRDFGKMRDRRMAKAMGGRTRRGEQAFHNHWIDSEWRNLERLHAAGINVPKPILRSSDGVLMGYIGDENGPAPRLVNCRLLDDEASRLLDAIIDDLECMARHNIVHGDFSAYNILYDGTRHTVIDVPQAVDRSTAPDAYTLFQRDLVNIERYFSRYGLEVPIDRLMRRHF